MKTQLADLSRNNFLENLYKYDVIIINHYRLRPELYNLLMNNINDGGVLWINGFKEISEDNYNITKSDLITEEDFISIKNYKLENKKIYGIGVRKFIRYIWRKQR